MAEEKKGIVLPKAPRKAIAVNPHVMLLYSIPKAAKITICAQIPNSLLVEIGPESADFVDANTIQAKSPREFEDICNQIIVEGCPYDTVIFDTVTILDR